MAEPAATRVLARIPLRRDGPDGVVVTAGELSATSLRYPGGVQAIRLENARGWVIALPWMGQMVWDAVFDGVRLGMRSLFDEPVAGARTIGETYGCLAFHSGLLRNGVPGPDDDHPAHGEFPCAAMGSAWIDVIERPGGLALRLGGEHLHTQGFGDAYAASPSITLGAGSTVFGFGMAVRNRSGRPMPLMYMAHVNFDFVENARIVQPAPWTPAHVAVRRAVPRHVTPNPDYLALIATLAEQPERMAVLYGPERFAPEQVFYLSGLRTDADGRATQMLRAPDGWAFCLRHEPAAFGHCVRWLMRDEDAAVAAFALPSTCEPEGFQAERAKGNVRMLDPGAEARFMVEMGYLDPVAAAEADLAISGGRS